MLHTFRTVISSKAFVSPAFGAEFESLKERKKKTSSSVHVKALIKPPSGCFSIIHYCVHKFQTPKRHIRLSINAKEQERM